MYLFRSLKRTSIIELSATNIKNKKLCVTTKAPTEWVKIQTKNLSVGKILHKNTSKKLTTKNPTSKCIKRKENSPNDTKKIISDSLK